jgi:hypothetical protein
MDLDLAILFAIESNNNPRAHNKSENARGLGQIREDVLKDFNRAHPTRQYTPDNLFDKDINTEVTNWYANQEIPRLLQHFGIQDTQEHRIIAYNAGIGNLIKMLRDDKPIPEITENYLIKYNMGGDVRAGQQRLKDLGFDPGPVDGKFGPKTKKAFLLFDKSDVQPQPIQREFGLAPLKR